MKIKSGLVKLTSAERLHNLEVPIVGLTGGIATGKTTVSKILASRGFAVINADLLVKDVYGLKETKDFVRKSFPDVMRGDEIDFRKFREKVFKDKDTKKIIEDFIYERLPQAFLTAYAKFDRPEFIIYDVPLLFEKALHKKVDLNVVVYAPRKIQRSRLLARDGHLPEMAEIILDQQIDIELKKNKADFIIDNSQTEEELTAGINQFLLQITD